MAWKYDNHPVGFYVSRMAHYNGDLFSKSITHFTGTRKKNTYNHVSRNRPTDAWSEPFMNGFSPVLWNCLDLDSDGVVTKVILCATVADVRKQFSHDPEILAMIGAWK